MSKDYKKPIPSPQGESDFYWEKAKLEELWLRECPVNGPYFYPRDISPGAMRKDTKWIKATGKATLFTFSIVERAPHPGFVDDVPFVTAIVELEEGPLMPTNIVMDNPTPERLRLPTRQPQATTPKAPRRAANTNRTTARPPARRRPRAAPGK